MICWPRQRRKRRCRPDGRTALEVIRHCLCLSEQPARIRLCNESHYAILRFDRLKYDFGPRFEEITLCERFRLPNGVDGLVSLLGLSIRFWVARSLERKPVDCIWEQSDLWDAAGKLTPQPDVDPTVVIYVSPLPRGGLEGKSVWDKPATVQSVETKRIPTEALPAAAKTHNYLNGILARAELQHGDVSADEALMLDCAGHIAEGATSNVFFVQDGVLHTPSLEGDVLPGITREIVLEEAADAGIETQTGSYEGGRLYQATEAFLTNRTWELRPIATLDGYSIGGGPMTAQLRRHYAERVEARCYRGADSTEIR